MKRKSVLTITLICCAVLYGTYLFVVPFVVNTAKFEHFIERSIVKQTGYKFDVVNPNVRTGLLPTVIIKADELDLLNDDNSKALEIIKPDIKMNLLPLLFKKISIKNLSADSVSANFVYSKEQQFLIGQYPIKFNKKSKFVLSRLSLDIGPFNINLDDLAQNKLLKFKGEYFRIYKYKRDKLISLATDADLYAGDNVTDIKADIELMLPLNKISEDKIKLNVDIAYLNLADFTEYAKTLTNNKITELRGIVDIDSKTDTVKGHKHIKSEIKLDNFGIMQRDRASSIYSDFPIIINQDIAVINDGVKINNFKIISEGIDAFVTGGVYKTKDKFPNLDLKVTANLVKGKNLLPLFPGEENLNPDFNFYKLKEHMIYGNATGNLEIKGVADYPNFYGNILMTDVYLTEPIKDAPQNGIIKLSFKDHTMNLDAHVMTAPSEYVDVRGAFKMIRDRYSDMTIKTTKNIDLVKAKKVLMPLREIFKFELGPVPMMDVPAGFGNAEFRISGSREDPHAWGYINFRNGTASFITINNMVAHNIGGWVKFNGDDVTFKTTSLTLNNLPVDVNGKCTMKGDLSVDVKGDGQNSADLLKIINTSPILKELQNMLAPITSGNGATKVFLTIFGHVDRGQEPVFNKDLFAKGSVEFISNKMTFYPQKIPASDVSGIVNFDKYDGNFNINGKLVNSEISTNGVIKNNILTANAYSHKFNAGDYWTILHMFYGDRILPVPGINTVSTSFAGHYQGVLNINNFDYSKITAKGKVYNNFGAKSPIFVNNSDFDIKNGHLHLSQIRGMFEKNPFNLQIDIDNIMTPKQSINGSFSMKNFDISSLNSLSIPEYPQLANFEDFEGHIDIASKIKDNNIRLFSQLGNTSVVYKPKQLKIKIQNGNTLFDTDSLNFNKINAYLGEMPLFLNGKIGNIFSENPNLNLYATAKPTQEFFDQFFNSKSVYPIKQKGDLIISSKLSGALDKLSSKTNIKLSEDSFLYYMGASIGDIANAVVIDVDAVTGKDWITLNNFKYDKIIASQNGRKYPNNQLAAYGTIKFPADSNLKFNNFKIKTANPTDAKIFNIIFKKPVIKQGLFMSDLVINGDMMNPKVQGTFDVTSIDVPIVDISVNDVSCNFKRDNINVKAKGSILDNDAVLTAVMQNKLIPPYVFNEFSLNFDALDLNTIISAMENYETTLYKQNLGVEDSTKDIDPTQIIIKKGSVKASKMKLKELTADNFVSDFTVNKDKIAHVNNYTMNIANGTVAGDAEYNLKNNILTLNTRIKDINAQAVAESLFNMKGQVFGTLTGKMKLVCSGKSDTECLKTLAGNGKFDIADGRMPKLGSLEYLLKATNIVTSGITRISINSIIDLITPLKTGQFKNITGHYKIENGVVKDLEIFSHGKDLNLYLTGSYDIETYVANMEVYGTLSTNLTSVFGKLKNLSLNTLLNTIPFLNNTEYSPEVAEKVNKIPKDDDSSISRIFEAIIDGDINGFNYVKSFKWVK
ncbi:hypothetical protein IKP85_01590 [bacterium]|nr:hypothetical protein [bacterium]